MRTGKEGVDGRNFTQEGLVPYVVDAVYTMAHALEHLHRRRCRRHPGVGVCDAMKPIAGLELLHNIRQVSFIGECNSSFGFAFIEVYLYDNELYNIFVNGLNSSLITFLVSNELVIDSWVDCFSSYLLRSLYLGMIYIIIQPRLRSLQQYHLT